MDKKTYDVVVIGSGIGGLCVAARLAYAGYKTIVLERMPIIGGRYTVVDYKGYSITTGAGMVWGGVKDPVYLTLKDLNIDPEQFEMRVLPPQIWRIGGKDHELRAEDGLWGVLGPACRNKQEEEKIAIALSRAFFWFEPSNDISFMDWLHQVTDNETIHVIMHAIAVMLVGPNAWDIGAGDFFRYCRPYIDIESPMICPRKGLKVIIDALAKVITDNGGEVVNRTRVQRILVHDGNATGVEAKGTSGEFRIEAKVVINNAGPKKTVELVGEQNFDQWYLKEIRDIKEWHGLCWYLASDEPLVDYPGGLYTIDIQRPGMWVDFTHLWPDWSPKGKHLTEFYQGTASTTHDCEKAAMEYKVFMEDLHKTFPRFEEQGGEILLVHNYHGQWPNLRAWPPSDRHRRTPIENLYNVGDGVIPPGTGFNGGSGVAFGAKVLAEEIMARIKV